MSIGEVLSLVAVLVAMGALLGTMWWRLSTKISANAAVLHDRDAELHVRINQTRDEYVRRDDLMQHIGRIEDGQQAMQSAITNGFASVNTRIDSLVDRRAASGD